jgi:NitT/TauT family transport system substrate-binding protein
MDDHLEELLTESTLTRRALLTRSAQAAAAVSLGGLLTAGPAFGRRGAQVVTLRWISPRGTLQVMDDFNLWVPIKMGYFKQLGLDVKLIAGPIADALATTKFVGQNKADMGYPSPGVLTTSIDTGIAVKSVWNMISGQVFDFGLPADSKIKHPRELKGKSISLGSAGWRTIVDPMLVEVGVDPKTVRYVTLGSQWIQAVAQKRADAGLAWEGLRHQWLGQGLKLKFLIGTSWSKHPSNVYSVRAADLDDTAKTDMYTRFFRGVVMGLEFTKVNPRAAAQITYQQLPDLRKSLEPQAALDSMLELAYAYSTSHRKGQGWGWHYANGWSSYLKTVKDLGQTKQLLPTSDVFTNNLVTAANKGTNVAKARSDAKKYKLNADFSKTKVYAGFTM